MFTSLLFCIYPNDIFMCACVLKYLQAGKKRRMNTNKENDELSLFQQSIMSEIKATDKSINDTSDPVMAFCNYLTTPSFIHYLRMTLRNVKGKYCHLYLNFKIIEKYL